MGFVLGLMSVVAVLASILLMFVILLQEPKGGGIAAALGGSGMEAIGPAVGNVNRFTSWVAGIWMVTCFFHAVWMKTAAPIAPEKKPAAENAGTPSGETPPVPATGSK
jgi:protein translocase SecG subunit